jgi:pimeloyl-ACP methyl ester carboxylesterase
MTGSTLADAALTKMSRMLDTWVLIRLALVEVEKHDGLAIDQVDSDLFWRLSQVGAPPDVRVVRDSAAAEGDGWRELELEAPSDGPGNHPGSRKLFATAHVRRTGEPAPMVVLVHGFAIPFTGYDRWQAFRMRRQGAHTVRIDLPFHLRRRIPGKDSGAEFFSIDLPRMRAVVRQSVEDVAAVVAWARREVTPRIAVFGVSLGGLISALLAALVELDVMVAVAPLAEPAESFTERPPNLVQRRMGMLGDGEDFWGRDSRAARQRIEAGLAPITPRLLLPETPGERIAIVRPLQDLVVGPGPMARLAEAWGTELWDYPHGHITVMNAHGMTARIRDRLLGATAAAESQLPLAG